MDKDEEKRKIIERILDRLKNDEKYQAHLRFVDNICKED